MQFEELTLDHIKARTEEVGDCWIWQQGATNGYPQMKVQGRCCKLVRRMVVEIDGRPAEPRHAGLLDFRRCRFVLWAVVLRRIENPPRAQAAQSHAVLGHAARFLG